MGAQKLFLNGRVIVGDPGFTQAEALLIEGNRILLAGTTDLCRDAAGSAAEIVDLQGGCVLPGFIDSHAHLLDYGEALESVDLLGTRSFDAIVARVAEKVRTTPKGEWIYGRGWNPTLWDDPRYPDHEALSAAAPDNPVALGRSDGHGLIANAAAMAAAGIDASTLDPSDGQILRRADGTPGGTFVEGAMQLIKAHIPPLTPVQRRRMMQGAARTLHGFGITAIHDGIEKPDYVDDFLALAAEGRLGLRVAGMLSDDGKADPAAAIARFAGIEDPTGFFTLRCLRLFADGGLGAQGAALFEPYADRPDHAGFLMIDRARLEAAAEAALGANWQLCTHAIGDRAVAHVLDGYQAVLERYPAADHRFKIEHASLIAAPDFERIARLGVIASVQPAHVVADLPWVESRLGPDRIARVFAFRRMIEQGTVLAMGSDFPVESPDPLWGFYCGLTRATAAGQPIGGWMPREKLDHAALVAGYGRWAAFAGFQNEMIGTLEAGKRADVVTIDRDILTVEPEELLSARVTRTYVDGVLMTPQ